MIPRALEAEILRLHHTEHWPIGTIARQLRVHHGTVRRVLAQAGVPVPPRSVRASMVEPYLAFIAETLGKYPTLRLAAVRDGARPKRICACALCRPNRRRSIGRISASSQSGARCAR